MMSAFGLLATYAEDAYVELTGTQAINTGYKAFYNSTTKDQSQVVLDFQLTEVPANGTRIIGGDGGSKGVSYFSLFADGNFKYAYNGKETGTSTGKPVTTDRYTVQLPAYGNAVLSLNGSQLATSWVGMANGTMPNPIVLGANALDAAGTSFSDQVAKMKIYGFKILEKKEGAWTTRYDFKPVVKGGVACLYDEATGMTLQDDRGRALASGGDIETLPEDGYVQSNGSSIQGINSRFFWQPGAKVEVDYELTDSTKNSQYRIVGADMFDSMVAEIRDRTVRMLLTVVPRPREEIRRVQVAKPLTEGFEGSGKGPQKKVIVTQRRETAKVGRNDPCPCGSGKKYKNCCGRNMGAED